MEVFPMSVNWDPDKPTLETKRLVPLLFLKAKVYLFVFPIKGETRVFVVELKIKLELQDASSFGKIGGLDWASTRSSKKAAPDELTCRCWID